MFEYKDDKLGTIKVLNVTEARANFATVLGDAQAHYIITKNNKPLRVIIDYKEYEILKQRLKEGAIVAEPTQRVEQENIEIKKRKRSKSRVKGLLENSMPHTKESEEIEQKVRVGQKEDYRKQAAAQAVSSFEQAPESPVKKSPQPVVERQPIQTEPVVKKQAAPVIEKEEDEVSIQAEALLGGEEGDYFQTDDLDSDEDLLITPDEATVKRADDRAKTKANEILRQEDGITEEVPKKENMSPEEEEYFKKYKKLYETLGVQPEEAIDEDQSQDIDDQINHRFNEEEDYFSESLSHELPSTEELEPEPVEKVEKPQKRVIQEKPLTSSKSSKEDLPSLKELLKDLEQEKLSGEDVSDKKLDDNEIDDLIERITQD